MNTSAIMLVGRKKNIELRKAKDFVSLEMSYSQFLEVLWSFELDVSKYHRKIDKTGVLTTNLHYQLTLI